MEELDTLFNGLEQKGAKIVDEITTKSWGLRDFTIQDLDGVSSSRAEREMYSPQCKMLMLD